MKSKLKKILAYLPSYPHYKMNVFSGTNSRQEIETVKKLLDSNELIHGEALTEYNTQLQKRLDSKYIYTFASGRMGFYTILQALGIEEGDEVIIPSFTCIVVPNAILYAKAKPIYCDISADDFNIDVAKIEALITPKTKVLYAQHTFGQMCDIEAITALAKKYNLLVIEDAALAIGAKKANRHAGTIGDFGYFSTDRSKVINTGLGGIVNVNNEAYKERFEALYKEIEFLDTTYTKKIARTFIINCITLHPSVYWFGKFLNAVLTKLGFMTYFLDESLHSKEEVTAYPYPAKLSNVFAAIGISQMKHLDFNLEHRKDVVKYYNNILHIYSEHYLEDEANIFLRYSFLVENRDYWEERFASVIDLSVWFKTIASGKNDNFEEIGYTEGTNKVSEYVCKHIFNLPTHNNINPEKLHHLLVELKNSGDIITKETIL